LDEEEMVRAAGFQTRWWGLGRRAFRVTLSSNFGDEEFRSADAASFRSNFGTEGRVKEGSLLSYTFRNVGAYLGEYGPRSMKLFREFRLDTINHCLWRGQERVSLTPKAFDVLRYLVEHADRLVSQDEIFETLWPKP